MSRPPIDYITEYDLDNIKEIPGIVDRFCMTIINYYIKRVQKIHKQLKPEEIAKLPLSLSANLIIHHYNIYFKNISPTERISHFDHLADMLSNMVKEGARASEAYSAKGEKH